MTQGCQLVFAYLNGIPAWCDLEAGHVPPCAWPDVSGYVNSQIQVDPKTWAGTANFRFPPGMPPVLEPLRTN